LTYRVSLRGSHREDDGGLVAPDGRRLRGLANRWWRNRAAPGEFTIRKCIVSRIASDNNANTQIDRIVKRIARKFHPEKIILFGSQARGDAGRDSDIDLLVVMPIIGSFRAKRLEVSLAVPHSPLPVDIIVTTPEDLAWRKDIVGTIEWPAMREGKVLYARG
jgi:predicted nucleotidyltransferase